MLAGWTTTFSRRPSVSTRMWRLRPVTFLPASNPCGSSAEPPFERRCTSVHMWCPSNYLTPHIESHPIPPIQQLSGTALSASFKNNVLASVIAGLVAAMGSVRNHLDDPPAWTQNRLLLLVALFITVW